MVIGCSNLGPLAGGVGGSYSAGSPIVAVGPSRCPNLFYITFFAKQKISPFGYKSFVGDTFFRFFSAESMQNSHGNGISSTKLNS
jgi:hypothetical protein